MRLGIVADVHEAVSELRQALAEFRRAGVDQVVSLGDACDTFSPLGRAAEVVALLRDAGAVGVWGNHDVGLSLDVSESVRRKAGPDLLAYTATLRPRLVLAGCRFSHVEPWLDPNKIEDLWYFGGRPDTPEAAARSFAAVPEPFLFVGHFHCWLVMTPAGRVEWAGEAPLTLAGGTRYLIVIAPVFGGWCATFDTGDSRLTPVRCAAG